MFGKNPIRKPEKGDGSSLKVQEIFPTLQGEARKNADLHVSNRIALQLKASDAVAKAISANKPYIMCKTHNFI